LKIPPAPTRAAGAKVTSTEKITPSEKLNGESIRLPRPYSAYDQFGDPSARVAYVGKDSIDDYAKENEKRRIRKAKFAVEQHFASQPDNPHNDTSENPSTADNQIERNSSCLPLADRVAGTVDRQVAAAKN
jgi:hypothetical protein